MSQLLLTVLQLGFVALLWVFVMAVVRVLRTDIYGTRIVTRGQSTERRTPAAAAAPAPPPRERATRGRAGRLVVTQGPLRGTTVPLENSAVVIGRADDSTLVLDDDFASARHARLTPGPEGWVIEDLGSTNGTRVNGQRLEHPSLAPEGTAIQIGKSVLELRK